MTLEGKRVLITGGGSGLGADLANGFAARGAETVIAGRRPDALETVAKSSPRIRAVPADVTDEESVSRLFAEAGRCDIVIANAGASESMPFDRTTTESWNRMISVNLTGVFFTLRAGLAQMDGWGRLIAVASTAGVKGYPYVGPYVAAKHGVVGLVRSLALEVAPREITANALCPGFLDTEMTERSVAQIVKKTGRTDEEALAALCRNNPQGRLIQPGEVTAAALWLCNPDSASVNGQAISISGGET